MAKKRDKEKQRDMAKERIKRLFELSHPLTKIDSPSADMYVKQAQKISKKCNVSIPSEHRLEYCKKCGTRFGFDNSRTRLKPLHKKIALTCKKCGYVRYLLYS